MRPNFLLIGAAKAGTTSLHEYLGQHPEIFMSQFKEPGYFTFYETDGRFPILMDRQFITEQSKYEELFDDSSGQKILGESSTYYLDFASKSVVKKIKKELPDVKLLVILRQPVDQAYSRYQMWVRDGNPNEMEFKEKFIMDFKEFNSLNYNFYEDNFVTKSYFCRLKIFTDYMDRNQVKIMIYDDFVRDKNAFIREVFSYLGVDASYYPDMAKRPNTGGVYQSSIVASIFNLPNPVRWFARKILPDDLRLQWQAIVKSKLLKPTPQLDPLIRNELTALMGDEISKLENLISRDLSVWRL